jgi:hypothetical protein
VLLAPPENITAATPTTIGTANIGNNTMGNFFQGMIQNCRFWNTALVEADVRNWIYDDPISDTTLMGSFNFSVSPPVDTTDLNSIVLQNAVITFQPSAILDPTSPGASIGVIRTRNPVFQGQTEEVPGKTHKLVSSSTLLGI